jgi:hypothetical protein
VAEVEEPAEAPEQIDEVVEAAAPPEELEPAQKAVAGAGKAGPGFSKLLEDLAALGGFYKTHAEEAEVTFPAEPTANSEPLELETEAPTSEPESNEQVEGPAAVEESTEAAPAEDPVDAVVAEVPAEFVKAEQSEEPVTSEEPAAANIEQSEQPAPVMEGTLQTKLAEVRAKADDARMAKLKANSALYEGLSAAYDFALDAEGAPEEYLKLVEAQGLKIQLRSPMKPVVKLAFNGLCDDSTISQLEAVLAWALEQELPRGSLAGRIEEVGGIAPILRGEAQAA